jgi:hypothetical protein
VYLIGALLLVLLDWWERVMNNLRGISVWGGFESHPLRHPLVARERLRGSMGTLAFQSYLEAVPVQDPDSFPHIPNAIWNANCDILTVKRGGKDGAF